MKNSIQQYELTIILDEKAAQEQATAKADAIKALIKKLEGTVTKDEFWGRRELAYEIKGNRSGFYVTLWFDAPTSALIPLERELRFDESILRFLTTKAYTEAQPGTLYPVVEEEKERKPRGDRAEKPAESATGEEAMRRTSSKETKEEAPVEEGPVMAEEERLEKLDVALDELLKDDQE